MNLAQVVPVFFSELGLHLFNYLLHGQLRVALSVYEASKVVITTTLNDICN